jgi:preprotein translocase subunit SecG
MYGLITILIIIASILLIIVVLIQNPKGGGLSQTFGGVSSQFFGVRQTTDFIEKSTWGLILFVGAFCLLTSLFKPKLENVQGVKQTHFENIIGKENLPQLPSGGAQQQQQQQQAAPKK